MDLPKFHVIDPATKAGRNVDSREAAKPGDVVIARAISPLARIKTLETEFAALKARLEKAGL